MSLRSNARKKCRFRFMLFCFASGFLVFLLDGLTILHRNSFISLQQTRQDDRTYDHECEWYFKQKWNELYVTSSEYDRGPVDYNIFPLESTYDYRVPLSYNEISKLHTHKRLKSKEDPLPNIECIYDGKIFNIGLQKTGTTSIANALQKMSYECNGYDDISIATTCANHPMRVAYPKMHSLFRSWRPINADDISEAFINRSYTRALYKLSHVSQVHADAPWCFYYPLWGAWYPGSKFIYTLRASTYRRVNSALKFELRTRYLRKRKSNRTLFDAVTDSLQETEWTWGSHIENLFMTTDDKEQFVLLMSRVYEKHHRNVMQYFQRYKIGHSLDDDLLILCLECESHPWQKLFSFLGCTLNGSVSIDNLVPFPHKLSAVDYMPAQYIPPSFDLNWTAYDKYGGIIDDILGVVYDMRMTARERVRELARTFWRFNQSAKLNNHDDRIEQE